jgi:hypothetical protein
MLARTSAVTSSTSGTSRALASATIIPKRRTVLAPSQVRPSCTELTRRGNATYAELA